MSKVTFNLGLPKAEKKVSVQEMDALSPALVKSRDGEYFVLVKVYTTYATNPFTFLCLKDGARPMWASDPDYYTFIRYLNADESVTISGGPRP